MCRKYQIIVTLIIFTLIPNAMTDASSLDEQQIPAGAYPCGPLAVTACAKYLGISTSYNEVEAILGKSEIEGHTLLELSQALKALGIPNQPAKGSLEGVLQALKDDTGLFILAVRRLGNRIDHCIVAAHYDGQHIMGFDYPDLPAHWTHHAIDSVWDGEMIFIPKNREGASQITFSEGGGTERGGGARNTIMWALLIGSVACVTFGIIIRWAKF
jgi:hypothetical protein